jgi:O-acetylhomoserine/O-acetylserine sulfhydrylase-like pyridoxal-dependent enzyme
MIRHPNNATHWQNIDSQNPEFAIDPRNIRITMSIDDMNP